MPINYNESYVPVNNKSNLIADNPGYNIRPMDNLAARIRQRMLDLDINQEELGKKIGYTQPAISKILSGETLEPKRLNRIATALKTTVDWLSDGRGPMNVNDLGEQPADYVVSSLQPGPDLPEQFRRIPVVGTAQLGPNGYWTDAGYPAGRGEGYIEFFSRDLDAYALRVQGDSMSPTIKSGWFVVVEPNSEYYAGDHVIVYTVVGQRMCKEFIFERNGEMAFNSVNSTYGRITLRIDEIEKIHLVTAIITPRKFRSW